MQTHRTMKKAPLGVQENASNTGTACPSNETPGGWQKTKLSRVWSWDEETWHDHHRSSDMISVRTKALLRDTRPRTAAQNLIKTSLRRTGGLVVNEGFRKFAQLTCMKVWDYGCVPVILRRQQDLQWDRRQHESRHHLPTHAAPGDQQENYHCTNLPTVTHQYRFMF